MSLNIETILTSGEVNQVLGYPTSLNGDDTYLLETMLRAIALHKETKDLKELKGKFIYTDSDSVSDYLKYINDFPDRMVSIVRVSEITSEGYEVPDGWKEYDFRINEFLSQYVPTQVFYNPDAQRVVYYIARRATRGWERAVASTLCKTLKWYFPEISEDEINLFRKISSQSTADEDEREVERLIIEYAQAAYDKYDFQELVIQSCLNGLSDYVRSNQIRCYRDDVERYENDICSYLKALEDRYKNLDNAKCLLSALEAAPAGDDGEIIKFFKSHKQIKLLSRDGATITYEVVSELEYYDEDEFNRVCDNSKSYIHQFSDSDLKYIKAIFADHLGTIRIAAQFKLGNMKLVSPIRGRCSADGVMPNPHIYFHACSGGNDLYYSHYASTGEWDMGVEQSIAATKNVNFGDSIVVREMIDWILGHKNTRFIYYGEDRTTLHTFEEFMKYVDEKEQEKTENE